MSTKVAITVRAGNEGQYDLMLTDRIAAKLAQIENERDGKLVMEGNSHIMMVYIEWKFPAVMLHVGRKDCKVTQGELLTYAASAVVETAYALEFK